MTTTEPKQFGITSTYKHDAPGGAQLSDYADLNYRTMKSVPHQLRDKLADDDDSPDEAMLVAMLNEASA